MEMQLTRVHPDDLTEYRRLEEAGGLARYTSRTRPHEPRADAGRLYWRYIECDGCKVGALWMEKEAASDDFATLGIFLSPTDLRAKGIGRRAISRAIAEAQGDLACSRIVLSVRADNERGFRCYRHCGFEEVGRFTRSIAGEEVLSIQMVKQVRAGEEGE